MRRPRFIAEQARHAKGLLGRIIAIIMARETWAQNRRAIAALGVRDNDRVLDIGCGPGRSLGTLAALAAQGHVAGVDPSVLMAEIAAERNRALVTARRVEIVVAGAASLPFADGSFDKVLCVHVIYFWDDMAAALGEIARVLKPQGRLALVFRTSADERAVRSFPAEVYRFPVLCDVVMGLEAAGFSVDPNQAPRNEQSSPVLLVAVKQTTGG
jgi:ubiquinone/menaquinone biosynthesis C-methylase UbiE